MGDSLRQVGQRSWFKFALAIALVLVTLAVYIPAMRAGFIWNDDEQGSLVGNVVLQERGLYRVWFTTESINYWPVVWTSYWLEYQFWELDPTGYHVVNVLVHAANALLIWRILLFLKIPGAWLAALLFAVHPVNVESVAWVTQRKNLLCLFFFLLTSISYLRFTDDGRRAWYGLAAVTFVLAMLSKGAAAPLPMVLLLCVWWRRGRVTVNDVKDSVLFFVIAAVISLIEIRFQYLHAIGEDVVRDDRFLARLVGAAWVVGFYLYKAVLPINLSFVYPRWQIDLANWLSYVPGLLLLAVVVLSFRYRRKWGRALLYALGYCILMLLPVLGFFDIYFMKYSFVADHYQYLSIIAIIALIVAVGRQVLQRFASNGEWLASVVSLPVVVVLFSLTWQQSLLYQSSESIWRDTLDKNPKAWMAHNNLGTMLELQGKRDLAIYHYRQALIIKPDHIKAYNNLGNALAAQGDYEGAVEQFHKALALMPRNARAHINLGNVRLAQGRLDEAIEHYEQVLAFDRTLTDAHNNLAVAFMRGGRVPEALKHYEEVSRLEPRNPAPLNSMAWTLATHPDSANRDTLRAIELAERAKTLTHARNASILDTLAAAYAASGQFVRAVKVAEEAIKLAQSDQELELANVIGKRLKLYGQEKPYREAPR